MKQTVKYVKENTPHKSKLYRNQGYRQRRKDLTGTLFKIETLRQIIF